ncbi:hypothetical protein LZ32DRAFT_70280 [Colletotrichum eremochloae]|nr:hypothetical protein LZ32DRAFT_70280 [Colletotrichum eremochloae]
MPEYRSLRWVCLLSTSISGKVQAGQPRPWSRHLARRRIDSKARPYQPLPVVVAIPSSLCHAARYMDRPQIDPWTEKPGGPGSRMQRTIA